MNKSQPISGRMIMNSLIKNILSIGALVTRRHHRTFLNDQRGALLIGIIATIVILSALSGGLVYIFSSSTLNPVSGNYAQRAYLNANAGINYVIAVYRNARDNEDGRNLLKYYETERTMEIPGSGSVKVIISGMTSDYIPAEATYVSGSNNTLTLTPTTGSFPDAPGFFKKKGVDSKILYRYLGKTSDNGNIVLTGITPSISASAGEIFITNEQITIDAQGTVGTGLWSVNRKVSYIWPISGNQNDPGTYNKTTGEGKTPYPPDNSDVAKFNPSFFNTALADGIANIINWIRSLVSLPANYTATDILQWWFTKDKLLLPDEGHLIPSSGCGLLAESLGTYWYDQSESALRVSALTGTYGGGFFLPYNYNFEQEWLSQGNKLSYDAQTKVKLKDGWFADRYLVGLSVRADSHCYEGWDLVNIPQFGISFAKGHNYKFKLPTNDDIYIVFWRKFSESDYKLLAYKKIASGEGIGQTVFFEDDMEYAVSETPTAWEVKSIDGSASDAWTMTSASSSSPSHSYKGELYYTDPGKIVLDKHYTTGLGLTSNYAEIFLCTSSNVCTSVEKWDGDATLEKAEITIPNNFKPSTGSYLKFYLYRAAATSEVNWWINAVHIYGVFSDYMNDYTQWPTHDYWTAGVYNAILGGDCMRGYRAYNISSSSSATLISTPFNIPATVVDKRNESLISPAFNTTGAGITDSSEIQLTFKHKLQIYDGYAIIDACQGNNCSNLASTDWVKIHEYTSDINDWATARDNTNNTGNPYISLPSAYVNKTNVRIRFRLKTSRVDKFPVWYIDDVKVATPKKLVDWATLGVRVREKLSPRSNEFEVFYGHPGAWNNGTGPNEIPYDVNRGPCLRDQNCWLPSSPINTLLSSADKLTLVTANTSDPYANANPWYWWYDSDGNYKDTVDDGITDYASKAKGSFPTTSARKADSDGCVYTLTGGTSPYGSLEPSAIIKTSGNNCRTTEYYTNYTNSANQVEEFGIHVYSDITGDTGITGSAWFDDTNILIRDGASQYHSGVQR